MSRAVQTRLQDCLRELRLPTFRENCHSKAALAEKEGISFAHYLLELCEMEVADRRQRRIDRKKSASKLPPGKTLSAFDRSRLPTNVDRQLSSLVEGDFLDRRENVLFFGPPGSGKTHLMCAVGHELVLKDQSVYFTSCAALVQRLLRAKQELTLEKEFKRLDRFQALLVDDLGYVQQSREEMEVLFTLLSHRYEHRSLLMTSNLAFSHWERIFKDPMTTVAAIDRLVHHSVILELNLPSYRMEEAKKKQEEGDQE